jgi:heme-degrading monooxygenase HmoA
MGEDRMSADQRTGPAEAGHQDGQDTPARVLFFVRLRPGTGDAFLAAYEAIRWEAAKVPGHLRDQVCQSEHDPDEWLITSEWASEEDFLAWERTPGHRETAAPMISYTTERRSLRFAVRATTRSPEAG